MHIKCKERGDNRQEGTHSGRDMDQQVWTELLQVTARVRHSCKAATPWQVMTLMWIVTAVGRGRHHNIVFSNAVSFRRGIDGGQPRRNFGVLARKEQMRESWRLQ
ncbi:hypothetical protein Syun_031089 [Stephania yunnanensis]|uniref:Uncharacterized protein n=1 Tax=Stephania yunnanensis TaxID=152371 RepID=A0AAP0HEW7_9MAGN